MKEQSFVEKYTKHTISKISTSTVMPTIIGGVLLYSLYTAVPSMLPSNDMSELTHETEALYKDQELFSLFLKLQKFKHVHPEAFAISVDCADKLVFLHYQLQKKEVCPVIEDRPNAFLMYKKSIQYLENMVVKSKTESSTRVPVEVHRIYLMILSCLERHWTGVLHLTQVISTG